MDVVCNENPVSVQFHNRGFVCEEGVRQKSQLAQSAVEGGVHKGMACWLGGGPEGSVACLLYRE